MSLITLQDSDVIGQLLAELEATSVQNAPSALDELRRRYGLSFYLNAGGARDEWTRLLNVLNRNIGGSSAWAASATVAATAAKNGRVQFWNDGQGDNKTFDRPVIIKKFSVASAVGGKHQLTFDTALTAGAVSGVSSFPLGLPGPGNTPWGGAGGGGMLQSDVTLGAVAGNIIRTVQLPANGSDERGSDGFGFFAILPRNTGLSWWCNTQNQAMDVNVEFAILNP